MRDLTRAIAARGDDHTEILFDEILRCQNNEAVADRIEKRYGIRPARTLVKYHQDRLGIIMVRVPYDVYLQLAEEYGFKPRPWPTLGNKEWQSKVSQQKKTS